MTICAIFLFALSGYKQFGGPGTTTTTSSTTPTTLPTVATYSMTFAGASRYEGTMDFDYDYGDVTLLVFDTNADDEHVARAIVEYDVTTGGTTIHFTTATKYELRDIGPGGGCIAVDNSSYASDGLGGFWRYIEMAPVESTGYQRHGIAILWITMSAQIGFCHRMMN